MEEPLFLVKTNKNKMFCGFDKTDYCYEVSQNFLESTSIEDVSRIMSIFREFAESPTYEKLLKEGMAEYTNHPFSESFALYAILERLKTSNYLNIADFENKIYEELENYYKVCEFSKKGIVSFDLNAILYVLMIGCVIMQLIYMKITPFSGLLTLFAFSGIVCCKLYTKKIKKKIIEIFSQ